MLRMMLKAVGGLLVAFGILWALQGLGLLDWPRGSFMLAKREWAIYGAVTAATGAVFMWLARPRSRV